MNQGTGARRMYGEEQFQRGAQEALARIAAADARVRARIASRVSHGTSPAAEEPPLQVPPPAVSDSTAAPSASPPGPPDSPGDLAPGTPPQITGIELPPLSQWRELRDSQGKWRDIRIDGHRFSILETEFEPRVFEYVTWLDGESLGQYGKARDALAELQQVARGLVPR